MQREFTDADISSRTMTICGKYLTLFLMKDTEDGASILIRLSRNDALALAAEIKARDIAGIL